MPAQIVPQAAARPQPYRIRDAALSAPGAWAMGTGVLAAGIARAPQLLLPRLAPLAAASALGGGALLGALVATHVVLLPLLAVVHAQAGARLRQALLAQSQAAVAAAAAGQAGHSAQGALVEGARNELVPNGLNLAQETAGFVQQLPHLLASVALDAWTLWAAASSGVWLGAVALGAFTLVATRLELPGRFARNREQREAQEALQTCSLSFWPSVAQGSGAQAARWRRGMDAAVARAGAAWRRTAAFDEAFTQLHQLPGHTLRALQGAAVLLPAQNGDIRPPWLSLRRLAGVQAGWQLLSDVPRLARAATAGLALRQKLAVRRRRMQQLAAPIDLLARIQAAPPSVQRGTKPIALQNLLDGPAEVLRAPGRYTVRGGSPAAREALLLHCWAKLGTAAHPALTEADQRALAAPDGGAAPAPASDAGARAAPVGPHVLLLAGLAEAPGEPGATPPLEAAVRRWAAAGAVLEAAPG